MPKKDRFSHEAPTQPGAKKPGASTPASKRKHSQSAPTWPPPPPSSRGKGATPRPTARPKTSTRTPTNPKTPAARRRKPHSSDMAGATVDEVVADMSKDPRREKD
jgi:hypothetical protein